MVARMRAAGAHAGKAGESAGHICWQKINILGDRADMPGNGFDQTSFFLHDKNPMKTHNATPMGLTFERRRFGRIHIFEPRVCHIHLPQSQKLWTDQGILVNISLGGIYFVCDQQPPIEKGDICYLTFDTPYADSKDHYLGLHVLVVRSEQVELHLSRFAVALRIISKPIYYSPHNGIEEELTSSNKISLMYQYYDLNKKAYKIIANTSEIWTDKINNIKNIFNKGTYMVQPDRVTQSLINNLFLENILRLKR
jgi:hypothetical protein